MPPATAACGLHASPWQDPSTPTWHDIEPWATHIDPDAHYLRAFLIAEQHPCTFDLAFIRAIEDLDIAPPRAPIPVPAWWAIDESGVGPDTDRPAIASFRARGELARSILRSRSRWHPDQIDLWKKPTERLERIVPYHNVREMAGRLAQLDGITYIKPPELKAEVERARRK